MSFLPKIAKAPFSASRSVDLRDFGIDFESLNCRYKHSTEVQSQRSLGERIHTSYPLTGLGLQKYDIYHVNFRDRTLEI
jgi:hypothetical protein